MKSFLKYRASLDALLDDVEWGNSRTGLADRLHASLNGGAASALRETVSAASIRKNGAYFTGESLGRQMVSPLAKKAQFRAKPVCDPTCGSGDLLLRWAEHLPVARDLGDTLEEWQSVIHGIDLHEEFLSVAKRRLALLAITKGARLPGQKRLPLDRFFPGLVVGNILQSQESLPEHSTLIMNPPFTHGNAPRACSWATGRISHAALAFMKCLEAATAGQRFAAILPDVLRSGYRYSRWRREIEHRMANARVEIVGRFDEHADVDVFILHGEVVNESRAAINWHESIKPGRATISSLCTVRVGAVVPHRDESRGPWHQYVTVHDLPAWAELSPDVTARRHWTHGVRPPFVAVRRTSSPSDKERAIGTLVRGSKLVVAENHLITLRPNDGKLDTCRKILNTLKSERTRRWLNRRIRCRHLTVGSVKDIPLIA